MDTKIARNLSIKQIRAFVCVAKHQSFSRAAQELAISQPALTLSVQQLEDIIGAALLQRTTRSVSLTQQGQEFRPKAEKILRDIESAVLSARASALQQKNRVRIAALPSIAIRVLPAAIRDYAEVSPETRLSVQDDNGRGVQAQVLSHKADFGISNIWKEDPDLQFTPFMRDRFGLICRGDHPLAKHKEPLTWATLESHPFVGMAPDTGLNRLMKTAEGLPKAVTEPAHTVLTIAALVGLVENGGAISALPALAAPDYLNPSFVYRDLTAPVLHRDLYLITARGRPLSSAARDFRDFLLEHAHRISAMFPNNTVGCMTAGN